MLVHIKYRRIAANAVTCVLLLVGTAHADETALDSAKAVLSEDGKIAWYNAVDLGVEGQGWKVEELKSPFDRLPKAAEGVVTDKVWGLSRHSAGLFVRFMTDSSDISAKWAVAKDDLAMPHMPATGVSGLDLYVKKDGAWGWIGNGRPEKKENESKLFSGAPAGRYEYMVYLPLYNGTESLSIGINPGTSISKAPAFPKLQAKPMLFWGTSILQGGCASRPGMAYPSIIARRMGRPAINLGFSGNGKMDPELAALIAKLDVAMYVIDCAPNMTPELIRERAEPLVKTLRDTHAETPIVFVENVEYQQSWFSDSKKKGYEEKNTELKAAYDRLVAAGVKGLHYIPGGALYGSDHEATVDGAHATDLGFLRMADAIEPVLRRILDR
jgi:lysophospholipase L1-like esterase